MNISASPTLQAIFLHVLRARGWIVAVFAILTVIGSYGATRIPTDSAIERLVVAGDPVAQATLEFERVFPEGEQALLMLEAADPFIPATLQGADRLERELNKIPNVAAHSVLTLRPPVDATGRVTASDAERMRQFATGTT